MRFSGLARCAFLALVASLACVSSLRGETTSPFLDGEAKVVTGAGPPILPTRTLDYGTRERVEAIRPTAERFVSSQQIPQDIDHSRISQSSSGVFYPPEIEQHFRFSNDLNRNYYELSPTRGSPSMPSRSISNTARSVSGEGSGAPRGRQLPLAEPHYAASTPLNSSQTQIQPELLSLANTAVSTGVNVPRTDNRKNNPDLREFISGFVKYLNGNMAGGNRPIRNRINNRGPPRISDVPSIVLDPAPNPALVPPPPPLTTHDPPPYPFERPIETPVIKPFVSGVPLPEQIVPPTDQAPPPSSLRPPLRPIRPKPTEKNENKTKDTSKLTEAAASSTMISTTPKINATKVLGIGVSSSVTVVTEPPSKPTTNGTTSATTPATTTTPIASTTSKSTTPFRVFTTNSTTITPQANYSTTVNSATSFSPRANATTPIPSTVKTPPTVANLTVNISSTPVAPALIESSIFEETPVKDLHKPTKWDSGSLVSKPNKNIPSYAPRPGIVLDDPEYKPGGHKPRPIVTAPARGEIFDVTVSAVQGGVSNTGQPVIYPVELDGVSLPGAANGEVSVITTAEEGQHFVSIDGKRTYISLFNSETAAIQPTSTKSPQISPTATGSTQKPQQTVNGRPKRPPHRRPQQPPVRIDTCIVGDWSTCDSDQHEICRTEQGVSSCHCAPGYSRHSHRQPCKRVVSIVASVQVDKIYEHKLTWNDKMKDAESQEYLQLEYEIMRAMESAMSMTPFSDAFMGSRLNNIYTVAGNPTKPVVLNLTLQIEESAETKRPQVKAEVQKQLLGAFHRRNNNIGTSPLWAVPASGVSHLHDLDECRAPELNDCHVAATCQNTFGAFECTCPPGYRDEFASNPYKAGRRCETCSSEHCNHRGSCSYNNGQPVCQCAGNYYGSQCEVDGEVLGVAIGASVAAVIIILSTLACLCMWSRRWNKEQKCAGIGSPVFGYMPSGGSTVKTPGIGAPPYQVSLEDRLRWAQIADVMAQSTNHYAPEPVGVPTRPSSAMFGYGGTLPMAPMPLPRHNTGFRLGLRPGSTHNTRHDSSSEEEDRTDLLGRNFQVPRPKSRSSIANQSGIYYDVDYDQQDHYASTKHPGCIALNTYTMGRSHYYRT